MRKHYLDKAFEPQSVAVIGATDREASVGRQILQNIIDGGFEGEVGGGGLRIHPVTLADAGPFDYPLIGGVHGLFKVMVANDFFREIAANTGNTCVDHG